MFIDRRNSFGSKSLVPNRGVLDVRAGPLPPRDHGSGHGADAPRIIGVHVIVDGPIVTFIVANETALSVYVYPQQQASTRVAFWASGTAAGATAHASADVWQLRSVIG